MHPHQFFIERLVADHHNDLLAEAAAHRLNRQRREATARRGLWRRFTRRPSTPAVPPTSAVHQPSTGEIPVLPLDPNTGWRTS